VELAVLDPSNQSIAAALEEPYFYLRMPPPIQLQDLRHRGLEELGCGAHAKDAALPTAERRAARSKRLCLREQAAAAREHFGAVGREGDAPADAIEQLDAKQTLELANLAGQGGLAHVKSPGRERHAARFGNGREVR
jgi:hypothetical protein